MSRINNVTFRRIVDIVYKESGIVLENKQELVEARLISLCRKQGYESPEAFLKLLKKDRTGSLLVELLNQVSTNVTHFFREKAHFDFVIRTLMPKLEVKKKTEGSNRVRFWSAACSSGEEPYSLAMAIHHYRAGNAEWDLKILATDISTQALQKARQGLYSRQEVKKTPPHLYKRYFSLIDNHDDPVYKISDEIKQMIAFRRLNLLKEDYPFSGLFDLIMCRNVMIYFDTQTKEALMKRFRKYLHPGGILIIGHTESLTGYEKYFKRVGIGIYEK
ncbi:MAG: protein-glutamate O-methyltransferase CheR [Deltaproteobacteria bacterium]|nr:protein-glutamate O-methyltransferase CheR [Deltaproteobacteria bacterium]MBW2052919.1 protein-glutamate O-methyltransferase CheR [Deltaproteobacteria bacterium]MBW2141742.1 protein-glutamate O-methyltransferase CheR [Deltaproteobacteria bacterium]MBW2323781.1 protein-glutamate O-methyltransferase CheR [Deltaproteobacteria bacterium]